MKTSDRTDISPERILDDLPLSVYIKDQQHRFIYVNKATAVALGLQEPIEAIGRTDDEFFIDDLAKHWKAQEKNVLSGQPMTDVVEREVLKASKSMPHWVLTCKYPYYDELGRLSGIVGISKRIDKQYEELARNSQAVRGAQVGLWHIRYLPDGRNEAWYSPRWKEMLGYRDDEIPNCRAEFADRVHPDDFPKVTEARNRYAANPGKEGHYECEFRMKHKSKGWIWIRSYGEAQFSSDGKTCVAFAGSHTDITAHKDEHELHEEILSMLSALVFMKDDQKRFIFVNPELARYYGTTKEAMERERQRDAHYNPNKEQTFRFEWDDQRVLDDNDIEIQNKGLVIDAEDIINKATGEIRQLKTTKKLFMYPSRDPKKHVLGIATDITEALRKTKEERDTIVEAHTHLRRFLNPFSSVQELLDFRSKLPEAFQAINLQYNCIASGVLSDGRPGEATDYIVQAYATKWKSDFLRLRLARVPGNVRKGVRFIAEDTLLRSLITNGPADPTSVTIGIIADTSFGNFLTSILPKPISIDCRVIIAAGVSAATGPKRLSDLICFLVLAPGAANEDTAATRSLLYLFQRFTEALAQFYRNSELYTERKEFLTDVTHQLVTPLVNTIDICTSTVERMQRLLPDQITDRLCEVRGLVRHCAMFTRAFFAASQSDEAELVTAKDLNQTSVKVTRLMIDVGRDFRISAETKGLKIQIEEEALDSIGTQEIDEEWVRHALMNVVDNAVKYTASRSGGVIRLFGEQEKAGFALCVRNPSCIPIRAKYKERIYDRWFRSPEAEEEEVQGTGIGLALAYAVVIAHGGRIEVEQKELRERAYETTFRLCFPSSRLLT